MKHIEFLLTCLLLLLAQAAFAQKPSVTNVKHQSIGNKIRITYEVVNASKNFRIWAQPILITNDSLMNDAVIKSATGDIGLIASVDGPKIVEWEWYKDVASLPSNFKIDVKLKAQLRAPIHHALSFTGNSLAPFGLKYSFISKNGFYLSGKTLNFDNPKVRGTSYELQNGALKPSTPYKFDDAILQTQFLTLGYSRIIKPFLHAYAGVGVGIDRTLWKVTVLDGDLLPSPEQFWVESSNSSTADKTHWVYELGANLLYKRILLDVGVGLSNQKTVFVNLGIGIVFYRSTGLK